MTHKQTENTIFFIVGACLIPAGIFAMLAGHWAVGIICLALSLCVAALWIRLNYKYVEADYE